MRLVPLVHALKRESGGAIGSTPAKQAGQNGGQQRDLSPCPLPDIEAIAESPPSPELTAARQQAEALLQQARTEADQLRQQAQQEAIRQAMKPAIRKDDNTPKPSSKRSTNST
jgi:hypothetical protein